MRSLLALVMLSLCFVGHTQTSDEVKVGDELTLGSPSTSSYVHVDFPQKNFIIKRNGIADMKKMKGVPVTVVEKVEVNGFTKVTLARKDGKRFFRMKKQVTADLAEAFEAGELVL